MYDAGAGHRWKTHATGTAALSTRRGPNLERAAHVWKIAKIKSTRIRVSHFFERRVLLSYYVADNSTGRISTRFRSLPLNWFYEPALQRIRPADRFARLPATGHHADRSRTFD